MQLPSRRVRTALVACAAVLAIAIPVLGASPAPSAKPDKAAKPDKGPETPITLTGTIAQATDAKGRPTFTMTVSGKTWKVSAGPSWFWGDKNPLASFVGKSVTVVGTTHADDDEVDVETVDGKALREAGKPPWAGGPWAVGASHPGWKAWMADGKPGHGHGRDKAPGQQKDKSAPENDESAPETP